MSAPPASALSVEVLLRVADGKYGLFPLSLPFMNFIRPVGRGGGATGALALPPLPPTDPRAQHFLLTTPSLLPHPRRFELGTLVKDHDASIMHQTKRIIRILNYLSTFVSF